MVKVLAALAIAALLAQGTPKQKPPERGPEQLWIDAAFVDGKGKVITDIRRDELEVWIGHFLTPIEEFISVTPATRPNCRSRGVAMEEATTSGLAPGRLALTEIVGKSTCGNGETGNNSKANAPAIATAAVSSEVATGLRMKGDDRLMIVWFRPLRSEPCRPPLCCAGSESRRS